MNYTKLLPCLFLLACQQDKLSNDGEFTVEVVDEGASDVTGESESGLSADWVEQAFEVASVHPYLNNTDTAFDGFDGGTTGVRQFKVHFSRLETESGYDFVEIYNEDYKRIARYSGKSKAFWTKALTARFIQFRFVTDKSVTKWGFSIDKVKTSGCTTNAMCGSEKGWKCEQVYCITSPCFNHCQFTGAICGTRGAKECKEPNKCMGGNPPVDVPGECVPNDYCEYASDCNNLPGNKCWGFKWRCEENTCNGSCGNPEELNDCATDFDCARGQTCVDTGKRCITAPCYGVYQCQSPGQQEGATCGGIAALQCAEGLDCLLTDVAGTDNDCNIADRAGVCGHRPEMCIQLYKPACGCDGVTYGNSCLLAAAGAAFAHDGECAAPAAQFGEACGGLLGTQCAAGLSCDYGPLAGPRTNHDSKAESQCQIMDLGGTCTNPAATLCSQQYDPVCACNGQTFSNDCMRMVAGQPFAYYGQCKP